MRGSICLLYGVLYFLVSISGDTASYFIQMITHISLEHILGQTRMGFGRVYLPSKGPMKGKYVFHMAKSQICLYRFSIFN